MTNKNGGKAASKDPGMFDHLKEDFFSSIVVFLVALPLCIGIAVAVGVDPARALLTGIIGGIIVGFFAGSPLQVSGPAAGLFVIVADLIAKGEAAYDGQLGEVENVGAAALTYSLMVLGTSVFLAGVLQIVAGKLYLGQWFRAVSPAVIKGMLSGIGVLILVSQFHVMLDHEAKWNGEKAHGGLQYMATIPEAIQKCFWDVPESKKESESTETTEKESTDEAGAKTDDAAASSDDTKVVEVKKSKNHHLAALTGIITIACIIIWPMIVPEKIKLVPAALVGILVATAFASFTGLEIKKLDVSSSIFQEVTLPTTFVWFQLLFDPMVLTGAFVIGLVASAETLLCATAVDQMHNGVRTDYDKELTAQGVGNVLCGLIGALPMTGVIVRSTANINSGGKTRTSAILHGFWLLIFVSSLPFVLAYIPRAALGALLVHIGIKLLNIKQIRELWKMSRSEVAIYLITLIVIVVEDLLVGVVTGIVLSALKLLHRFSHLEAELKVGEKISTLDLHGAATFLRLPLLASKLDQVPDSAELHVDFDHLTYIDHACLDLLANWAKQHEGTGGKLLIDWDQLHGRFSASAGDALAETKKKTMKVDSESSAT